MTTRSAVLACLAACLSQSAVHRIEVLDRTTLGSYERIVARAHYRVDPKSAANRGITDLGLAPRNASGEVEFTSDLVVLQRREGAKSNGTALIDVPNRGGILALRNFNYGPAALSIQSPADLGDGFLMDQGFTIVSVGWQWDTPELPGRLGLQAPVLPSITGLARSEFVPNAKVNRFSLADRDHVAYPVADEGDAANRMTVREGPGLPRREISRDRWRFVDKTFVEVEGGCEPGKIYEVVYRAKDAVPVGLGFAAVRDVASHLKYGKPDVLLRARKTIGFGTSQTGRFLRHMLHEGFNQDEQRRLALDGVWAHVAGAGRGGFNQRFAQPSRDGQPHLHHAWPVDEFPFADTSMKDPLTGRTAGLVARPDEAVKIFYTNGSYEYWGRAASLIHTTPNGDRDVPPRPNTRIYFIAGAQHGVGALPIRRVETLNAENPLDARPLFRALLLALNAWVSTGAEPPPSAYPRISKGELVSPAKVKYPNTIRRPEWPRVPVVLDWKSEPPSEGSSYTVLVPQVDDGGNEASGVRLPEIDVALGTYLGWNFRAARLGAPDRMIAFIGSFFPFNDAQRRYGRREDFLRLSRESASKLARKRLLLEGDIDKVVERAGRLWDAVTAPQHAGR